MRFRCCQRPPLELKDFEQNWQGKLKAPVCWFKWFRRTVFVRNFLSQYSHWKGKLLSWTILWSLIEFELFWTWTPHSGQTHLGLRGPWTRVTWTWSFRLLQNVFPGQSSQIKFSSPWHDFIWELSWLREPNELGHSSHGKRFSPWAFVIWFCNSSTLERILYIIFELWIFYKTRHFWDEK